ncbi:16S rRNA (cytidine(1402)-2'-O)-methyltransferase [Parvularcula dongshanensis]|uniref:Ribosomal RNA small subunit methyltransferase I n=1 Tax=Parvularcula dongshanensis TaxID=1173995 RepID=A0A840HZP4_9PROT|nr:16S rRNA (cytidine1402-2'-O)-methyltransferase [Parvularcula dongshanensis]
MTETPRRPSDDPLAPGLYVAATPIGNLGDASARLLDVLRRADGVLCEDSRVTGKLLSAFGIENRLQPYHDHNGARVRPGVLDRLRSGAALVLVSDAGTPLVSDPGYKLVREVRAAGLRVHAVPGPSAPLAALMVSGAPSDRFSFHGFLPRTQKARRDLFTSLGGRDETLLFFETAPRLASALSDLADALGPRTVSIARELTKRYEEVVEGEAAELAAAYEAAPPKGEIVLIVHPAEAAAPPDEESVDRQLREALRTHRVKDAAAFVAEATGLPRRGLYARAQALKDEG